VICPSSENSAKIKSHVSEAAVDGRSGVDSEFIQGEKDILLRSDLYNSRTKAIDLEMIDAPSLVVGMCAAGTFSSKQRAVSFSLTGVAAPFLQLSILFLLLTSPKHASGRCNKRIVEGDSTCPSRRSGEPAGRSSGDYFQRSRHHAVLALELRLF